MLEYFSVGKSIMTQIVLDQYIFPLLNLLTPRAWIKSAGNLAIFLWDHFYPLIDREFI